MQARQDTILRVKEDCKEALLKRLKDQNVYKALLRQLIVQGLVRLMERDVGVRCKPSDFDAVGSVIDDASKDFTDLIKRETNYDFICRLYLDSNNPLKDTQAHLGGVILSAQQGTILCHNTIDARLDLCYQDSLPDIRRIMFPQ